MLAGVVYSLVLIGTACRDFGIGDFPLIHNLIAEYHQVFI